MAKITYIPEDKNPQGLQKIYYSGHPEDFKSYYSEITNDLFSTLSDCSFLVCRDEDNKTRDDELFNFLREVNLFVVPVTLRLLTQDNRTRDEEIPFVLKNHIPVLPLLQEPPNKELLDAFKNVFGELQYLYKYEKDTTALPYKEKLKTYLSEILLNDETAQKVRAAFDAYIFLSYRKKDRKYAQQLMRLIHSNEICQDIAIWYDEYLTPGENFNENIEAALTKSILFALAVTPNLVNEENYVMTVEYPKAQQAGIPILPVELEKTDTKALKDCYYNIPNVVDGNDSLALSKELLERLQGLALRENDQDPMHNFFIGLAYLSGIDVEIDSDRAVKLITSAAEANLPEAMEKLISMYYYGDGIDYSHTKSNYWLNQLKIYHKQKYDNSPIEENAKAYVKALSKQIKMTSFEDRSPICEEMYKFCTFLCETTDYDWAKWYLSLAFSKAATVAKEKGLKYITITYYHRATRISREIVAEKETESAMQDLIYDLRNEGEYLWGLDEQRNINNIEVASTCYSEALTVAERLNNLYPSEDNLYTLGVAYYELSKFYEGQKNFDLLMQAYEIIDQLHHADPKEKAYWETEKRIGACLHPLYMDIFNTTTSPYEKLLDELVDDVLSFLENPNKI